VIRLSRVLPKKGEYVAARDPDVRTAAATVAGLALAASRSPEETAAAMAKAREGIRQKLIAEIDPTGELARTDPGELERQLALRRRLRMAQMGLKSAQKRAARRAVQEATEYAALAESEAGIA
jgi:hypothetical protein